MSTLQQGYHAENYVCHYLQKAGLILLTRNFRCKMGEIDLIMRDDETIIFVEVRYRKSIAYGTAIESISAAKQKRLQRTADFYLQQYDRAQKYFWRFDWVGASPGIRTGEYKLEWIKNAIQNDY
jgi:putative endonuclease